MKNRASFFVALRYLWGRANEGGRYLRGAAAGIAVSLIPIIVTLIVADGMITGIIDRYLEFGSGHIQVFDLSNTGNEESISEKLKNINGVKGAWPERRGMGIIAGNTGKTGVTIRATEPSFWEVSGDINYRDNNYLKILEGVSAPLTERDIVLGVVLAENIGVKTGDTVRLMTIRTDDNGNIFPRTASFTVSGIISCGYNELDALWCITSWEGGKRVLSGDQSSASILVKIDNPYKNIEYFVWDLYIELGAGYSIYTWKDLLRSQYSSYESTRQMLLFIMALIVIVAAINVSSATSMLALERRRDIAILKISGSSIKGIANIFLMGGFLTGFFGSIIGVALGLLIGVNINFLIRSLEKILSLFSSLFNGGEVKILDPGFYLETIPIIIDFNTVILIGFFAVVCSVLASLIPAVKAGKLKPIELLRKT